jgi:hypothetical protein
MMALALGVAWMATGCFGGHSPQTAAAATGGVPAADRYRVVADATPFYRLGPQQAGGPDLSLKRGDEVTMDQRSYGYSRVTTSSGMVGYVGTEDITQLTAEDLAAENAAEAQAQAQAGGQKRSSAIVGEYTLPPGATSLDQLPESDPVPAPTPKPTPNPYFRY